MENNIKDIKFLFDNIGILLLFFNLFREGI
jgi:hypothetical protein